MSHFSALISRYWLLALGIVAVVGIATLFSQPGSTRTYRASVGVNVTYTKPQNSQSANASASVQAWVVNPSIINQLFGDSVGASVSEKSRAFEVIPGPEGSSFFTIERTGANREQLIAEVMTLSNALNSIIKPPLEEVAVAVTDVTSSEEVATLPLAPLAGIIAGLVLAGVIISLLERARKQ